MQQLAISTLINEVLDCELHWEAAGGSASVKLEGDNPQQLLWHNVIKRLIRQMLIHGFVVYRVTTPQPEGEATTQSNVASVPPGKAADLRNPTAKKARQQLPKHKVEIRSGETVQLKLVKRTGMFVAVANTEGSASARVIARQGDENEGVPGQWRLQLYETPLVRNNDEIVVTSPASRAFASSVAHSKLMENSLLRDTLNSEPVVFTTVSDRLRAGNGSHTRPWFDSSAPGAATSITARPGPGGSALDFEQLISDRLDSITALQQMSATARKQTEQLYASAAVGSRSLHTPPEPEKRHQELMITDGMVPQELSYRRAPEDFLSLLERTVNDVLFQYSVPPQVLGKVGELRFPLPSFWFLGSAVP